MLVEANESLLFLGGSDEGDEFEWLEGAWLGGGLLVFASCVFGLPNAKCELGVGSLHDSVLDLEISEMSPEVELAEQVGISEEIVWVLNGV